MKYLVLALIASMMIMTGCASDGNKTAVTVYDSSGKVVQETSKDAVMLNSVFTMADSCNKAKIAIANNANLGVINATNLSGLSPSAQTEYARALPMMYMAEALKNAVAKPDDGCQKGIIAYYNSKNIEKQANASLWRKLIGVGGFIGGAYVIGNSVEGILQSAVSAGGTTNTISGSRVNMDSGNNYSSPGGIANASSSGDGLGTNNIYSQGTSGTLYGGNQPRGTTTNQYDQNGQIEFGSNSGDNAEQVTIPPVEPVE